MRRRRGCAADLATDNEGGLEAVIALVDAGADPMLKDLNGSGVEVRVCGTCQNRCGIYKGQPYYDESLKSTMAACAQWVVDSEKVLTF